MYTKTVPKFNMYAFRPIFLNDCEEQGQAVLLKLFCQESVSTLEIERQPSNFMFAWPP